VIRRFVNRRFVCAPRQSRITDTPTVAMTSINLFYFITYFGKGEIYPKRDSLSLAKYDPSPSLYSPLLSLVMYLSVGVACYSTTRVVAKVDFFYFAKYEISAKFRENFVTKISRNFAMFRLFSFAKFRSFSFAKFW
jgi:hypothetical protein